MRTCDRQGMYTAGCRWRALVSACWLAGKRWSARRCRRLKSRSRSPLGLFCPAGRCTSWLVRAWVGDLKYSGRVGVLVTSYLFVEIFDRCFRCCCSYSFILLHIYKVLVLGVLTIFKSKIESLIYILIWSILTDQNK